MHSILYAKFPLVRAVESIRSPRWRSLAGNDDATWTLTIVQAGGAVRLPDLGGDLLAEEVYRDVFAP